MAHITAQHADNGTDNDGDNNGDDDSYYGRLLHDIADYHYMDDHDVLLAVDAMWLHCPLIVLSNVLIISSTYFIKRLQTPDNLIIGGLAVVDLCTGLLSIPIIWLRMHEDLTLKLKGTQAACYTSLLIPALFPRTSLSILLLMAVDRFVAIRYPFVYDKYSSEWRVVVMIVCLFFVNMLVNLLPLFCPDEEYVWKDGLSRKENSKHQCQMFKRYPVFYQKVVDKIIVWGQILTALILTIISAHIAWKALKTRGTLDAIFVRPETIKAQMRKTKTALALMFLALVFWIPTMAISLAINLHLSTKTVYLLYVASKHCIFTNAWMNAIVYAISKATHRRAYRFLLTHFPWHWPKVSGIFRKDAYRSTFALTQNPIPVVSVSTRQPNQQSTEELDEPNDEDAVATDTQYHDAESPTTSMTSKAFVSPSSPGSSPMTDTASSPKTKSN